MIMDDTVPQFSEQAVELILAALPANVDQRRRELLPRILAEWSRTDLLEHLSRESRAVVRERYDQLTKVGKSANDLRQALGALDQRGRSWIAQELAHEEGSPRPPFSASCEKLADMKERLKQEDDFLKKIAAATLRLVEEDTRLSEEGERESGQPRNIRAYLVMMDLVAIFEWLTGRKATREVNRDDHKETGPFWHFAEAVWPYIFGKGRHGLSSAMKNWETWHKRCDEESQLIRNIAMRYPTWGIFNSSSTIAPM
jgi:hypothetical protein